jgi:type I restriction enzyme S subunit
MPFVDVSPKEERAFALEKGDFLFARSGTIGRFGLVLQPERSVFASYLIRFRFRECDPGFLRFAFSSHFFKESLISTLHGGANQNVHAENIKERFLAVPTPPEQRSIAAFLDRETAKLDTMVGKKERLIELLQEKRATLITRAMTKGLDPNMPMKNSGIEWLAEVPAHWDVAPVYSRYEVTLGKMLDAKRVTGEHLAPYLRNVDVQWDRVNVENLLEMDFHPEEGGRYGLRPRDLLVCEGGEVGRTAMWRGELKECFYQKAIHRVRPLSEKDVPRYFYYVMYAAAGRGVFVAGGNPNTIDHLTAIQLRHYRLPFPTKEEQKQIVAVLDNETAKIDSLIAKIREGIEKLKEYRTALISAAVTGKIDVREAMLT